MQAVPKMSTFVTKIGTDTNGISAGTALFGKTRRSVLALLYSHPDDAFYLRQVARAVGSGLGAIQRELGRLTAAGILLRRVGGRQVYYQANRACPIFAELQSLVIKTVGVADVLRAALTGLAGRIEVAFIHGSMAKGGARADSDVDVLVVGAVTFAEVVSALGPTQEKLGREVNPSVYPQAEFREKVLGKHHFLTQVISQPKIYLIGGESELAGMAEERLGD